jgi:hypothetical protein
MTNRQIFHHYKALLPLFLLGTSALSAAQYSRAYDHWNLTADAVFMRRNEEQDRPVVKDENKVMKCPDECDNFTVISCKGCVQHFHFDPGFRASLVYSEDLKNSFEGVFLWVRPWHGSRHANGDHSLFFPFDTADYAFDYVNAS